VPTPRQILVLFYQSARGFGEDNCSQMAASISYYVLFSLFPLLIFSVGIASLFLKDDSGLQQDLIDFVLENIPLSQGEGRDEVTQSVRDIAGSSASAVGIIGLIGMAWAGSSMFSTISRSINIAFGLDVRRPVVRRKLLDLALVLGLTAFFFVSIAATTALRFVLAASNDVPVLGDTEALGAGWTIASFFVPLLFSFVGFLVLYTVLPVADVHPRDTWFGALVGALLFEIAKLGFSFYVSNFSNFDVVFGSLGAVAAFLFWVYVSANTLLFGAEVAAEYPKVRGGYYDRPSDAPPKPKRTLREKVLAFLRRLVLYDHEARRRPKPPPDEPQHPAGG
jgi:membrane protein